MTDAEKIAAIRAVFSDLDALRQHFDKKQADSGYFSFAKESALKKIAVIVQH